MTTARLKRAVTLEDVARAAGVSRATASRVVRADKGVGEEKAQAVRRAVAELGYVPNSAARMLVTRRTDTIALVVPEPDYLIFTDPFFARIAMSVSRALRDEDIQLVILFADSDDASRRATGFLRDGRVDGAIIVSHHKIPRQIEAFASSPLPVVFVGRPFVDDPPPSWVDVDNIEGGRIAARRLLEVNVSRPAVITGSQDMTAGRDRLDGFLDVMGRSGIDPVVVEGRFTAASGREAARQLLPSIRSGAVDGVFVSSDPMALEALSLWRENGVHIPDDLKVVGFDDNEGAALASPALTTIVNPAEELGAAAARMVIDIRADQWDGEPVVLSTRLVPRVSG